jgi:hypothetical protein
MEATWLVDFNFPSRPIILDDLCYGKLQISGEHRYPLCLTEHPNDPDGTFEGLQHDHLIISTNIPAFTVEIDSISFGFLPNLGRSVGDRSQTFTVLTATAALSRLRGVRLGIQDVIAAQSGQYIN